MKSVESESVSHSVISDSLWSMDCSLPGVFVHGILQARTLDCVAMVATEKYLVIAFVTAGMVLEWETVNCPYKCLDNLVKKVI